MAIASSAGLLPPLPRLVVVLVEILAHVGHGGVGDLHGVAVDHLPQLMANILYQYIQYQYYMYIYAQIL